MSKFNTSIKAVLAVTKADLIATFKNMQSVFFGILFPLIFILIFGFIGGAAFKFNVAIDPATDKESPIYQALEKIDSINLVTDKPEAEVKEELGKGSIDAKLKVVPKNNDGAAPGYDVILITTAADPESGGILTSLVTGLTDKMNLQFAGVQQPAINLQTEEVSGREYKQIDFILPGQLGFALLSSGVFGTAFLFVNLRQTLVIKRFFATPIKKYVIVVGLAISKLLFSILQASVIIGVGALFFDFTLINGFETFISMIVLAMFGLVVFLGMGFIVSSMGKDENSIAPLANIFTMPQFLLAGTFFPIEAFPDWLQPVSRILPLTYLNDAMRQVAFEGVSIFSLGKEIAAIVVAGIVIYAIAIKIFKWEM